MEKKIVIATTNKGKLNEFKAMLEPEGYEVLSMADLPHPIEIDENGKTFSENAILKAQAVTDAFNITALADDSGIEIDAFGGEPGVHSARFLGHDTPYSYKNQIILERMEGETNRSCRYACAIAITRPNKEPLVFFETLECQIALEATGDGGFGYDPIVYYPPIGKTLAQISHEEKNSFSHRGKALRKLEAWLKSHEETM